MTTIKLTVPPDQTPAEEAELVARVAAALSESLDDATEIHFELETSETVDYQAMSHRTQVSDRWNR